jgi:predicted amidohydrolase
MPPIPEKQYVPVKVALVQMACSDSQRDNTEYAIEAIRSAANRGANIVCLPELFQSRYFPALPMNKEAFALAETIPGPTTQQLAEAAKENKVLVIGGSIFERASEGAKAKYFNTAPVFDDTGALLATYRKCHIPQDPGFYEKDYFAEGDGIKVIETKFGKICVMICFDQWFPEAARQAALLGAQLIVYPTAIGMPDNVVNITGDWREMWQTAQRGHAACNNVYVAAINRVGPEPSADGSTTEFFGGSFVADFAGHTIAQADDEPEIIMAECNFEQQRSVQEAWNFFPNRRPDVYRAVNGK